MRRLTVSGIEALKNIHEQVLYNIQQLEVVLMNGHLKIQTSEFAEMAVRV